MYKLGHYGGSLLVYAPVAFVLALVADAELAVAGAVVVAAGATLPDVDQRVPFVAHRGPTHTVWFALVVGAVCAAGGALLASSSGGAVPTLSFAALGGLLGTLTVASHLLADALTPMGIRPFEPMSSASYSLSLVYAANPVANYALLAAGLVAVAVAVGGGEAVANALGA